MVSPGTQRQIRGMAMEIGKLVGRRIKELREMRGLTQAQLANLLDKSVETISNFERGKVLTGLPTLDRLAAVLNVRVKDFFEDIPAQAVRRVESAFAQTVRNAADLLPEDDLEIVAGLVDVLESRRRRR